ncbi:sigma 54-interacting transcriptional regulator [Cetobacterium sp.]
MKKILLIAPYEEINDVNFTSDYLIKKVVNLNEVERTARKFEENGGQIIITRGGSAERLKRKVHIPIVEIKVTSEDILKIFEKFKYKNEVIGVVGYKSVINKCQWIADCMGIDIKILEIDSKIEQFQIISQIGEFIKKYKITNFMGDVVLQNILKNHPLPINFELIKSSQESVLEALNRAEEILRVKELEKEKNKMLTILLNHIDIGVIYFNKKQIIEHINLKAESLFLDKKEIKKIIEKAFIEESKILEIEDKQIFFNKIPLIINEELKGTLFTFREVETIENEEKIIRKEFMKKGLSAKYTFENFLTNNQNMNRIKIIAKKYSKVDGTILITGESGTGKEILAQSIHNASKRVNGPFIALNCSAIPSLLLESELFGYEAGSFTGASKNGKVGIFDLAHKGTIFLDEIGELPLDLQAKFLRVLQEKEFRRIGGEEIKKTDVRIIAATNVDLIKLVDEKKFRADLYYRLNVLRLETLALKDRKDDVSYLILFFLKKLGKIHEKYIDKLDLELLSFLENYDWPGNVRELENVVQRIILLAENSTVKYKDIELFLTDIHKNNKDISIFSGSLKDIKKKIILEILSQENNNKSKVAKRLEIDRGTLDRIIS